MLNNYCENKTKKPQVFTKIYPNQAKLHSKPYHLMQNVSGFISNMLILF